MNHQIINHIQDLEADLTCIKVQLDRLNNSLTNLKKSFNLKDVERHLKNSTRRCLEMRDMIILDLDKTSKFYQDNILEIAEFVFDNHEYEPGCEEFMYENTASLIKQTTNYETLQCIASFVDYNCHNFTQDEIESLFDDIHQQIDVSVLIKSIKEQIFNGGYLNVNKLKDKISNTNSVKILDVLENHIFNDVPNLDTQLFTSLVLKRRSEIDKESDLMKYDLPNFHSNSLVLKEEGIF